MRDGMRIDWNVPITMDNGLILRADVFRPVFDGKYKFILAMVPYVKGLALQDGYPNESLLRTERILHTSGQHIT
jgi:hypothetical protein